MTREKYKEVFETQYNDVISKIKGWHELPNVLQALSDYTSICIAMCERIYNDKDIPFIDYVDLIEQLSKLNKEIFRIVMR